MNFLLTKLNDTFRDKKAYFFIVLIMFCLGISFGLYTVKYMGESDKTDLTNYFFSFTNSIDSHPINYGNLLFEVIKKNILIIIPIFILGLTFFGAPVILILDLLKGFTLGYTFSFMITTFQGKGMGLALISIVPQNLIYIPCFIALSVISLSMSTERFKGRFFKHGKIKDPFLDGVLNKLIVILILFTIGILIETYISPSLIRFVANKFYL
ncbi:stage II sporulation protein M [Clostridium beijerinckii]|jgi:stage II sporulation protein M|uniref:Stage II sporulation protein M n=1 Tax=Clostridium beijerinckii TaxID=1520 RepID=A0AB74VLE3_CLOBE|nr:stage II sporulation protein M [Clostridium beijerinckii]MCI1580502.1 stage II sporulation protein M [Clostridium beijerinckii]MCI1585671.1 stage II sporulation protein M [Clostridium beijerinckii]MCI1624980.1 stage II sporulation protein M [Clostridium beijerinckii]NRZ26429.1 stage II sporulation protein M [Clostridium beijerinckii]NYB97768.1 stage II sporulation protein M [Clostridium beijerinckii]